MALGLLAGPALAQETPADNQQVRDAAIQSAQAVGVQSVQPVEGALVLQGISASGGPLLMVVGPAGELLGIATPIALPTPGEADAAAADAAGTGAEAGTTETASDQAAAPAEGEPAEEGFMETQAQPATPGMWDPAAFEGAGQGAGGGTGSGTEEQPQQ
jgi:hypothetical protein